MATERIDVVITDGIDASIAAKFDAIAKAAKTAYDSIGQTQKAQAQTANTALSLDKLARSAAAVATQQEKLASASTQTAVQQQRLATELERTNAAMARASAEITNTATAEQKLLAASASASAAQQRLAEASARAATAQAQTATATQQVAAAQAQASAAAARATTAQTQAATAAQRLQQAQAQAAAATTGAATAQQRLAQAQADSARAAQNAATAAVNNATAQQRLASSTSQAEAATARAELAQLRLQRAQEQSNRSSSGLIGTLQRFAVQMFALQTAVSAVEGAFAKVETFQRMQNALRQVGASEAEVISLTGDLLGVANRSRAPLDATVTTYQRITNALKDVGGTQAEALKITEALTKATATGNLTQSEQASALLQVSQAFNKGKLDGDEFRSVMENFPQFGDAIAKSMGLANKGLLFAAAKEGRITLDVMRDAMIKLGDTADQQLARSTETVSQAFTKLTNTSTILFGQLDKQLGISESIVDVLNRMAAASERNVLSSLGDPGSKLKVLKADLHDLQIEQVQLKTFFSNPGGEINQKYQVKIDALKEQIKLTEQLLQVQSKQPRQTQQDLRKFENKLDGESITDKQLKAQLKLDAAQKKAEERAARAAARPVEAIDREIERLTKKQISLENITEVERAQAAIEEGLYDKATPKQIQQLLVLARQRDEYNNLIAAEKKFAAESKRVNDESDRETKQLDERTISITAETQKIREQGQSMFATQAALIALDTAKQTSILQAKLSAAQTAQETEAINSQIAAIRAQGQAKTELADKQLFAQNSGLQTQLPQDIFKNTEEANKLQLEAFQSMKDQIDELERQSLLTHDEAERAKTRISIEQQQMRLSNSQTFFGNLASLSSSGNKRIAAIGKAAAVAQATIDGIIAVQKALAAPPGWPYNAPNVISVGIMQAANVAKLAGFQEGGYTGNGGRSEIAGVVHGKEWVVDADTTARNRGVLEAMDRGEDVSGSGPKIIINNLGTPQTYEMKSLSRDEVVLIARDVVHHEAPSVIAADMGGSNSATSKSLTSNFQVSRNRG